MSKMVTTFDGPELDVLRNKLKGLPENLYEKHLVAAMRKATKPGVKILKMYTPKGPTGNLKRGVKSIARKYKRSKTVFAAVGYSLSGGGKRRMGKHAKRDNTGGNMAYHQGLVEFGTKVRKTKGRFASSFATYNFSIQNKVNKFDNGVQTVPGRPYGFFKSSKRGTPVNLGRMKGAHNIPRAFDMSDDFIASQLRDVTNEQVKKAKRELAHRAKYMRRK